MHLKMWIGASLLTLAASATPLSKRISYTPTIILPDENTTWRIGELVNVTWDNSDAPEVISNPSAIQLNNASGPIPVWEYGVLSQGFDLKLGFAEVEVPWYGIKPGNYTITLFGNSGNRSPFFRIIGRDEE